MKRTFLPTCLAAVAIWAALAGPAPANDAPDSQPKKKPNVLISSGAGQLTADGLVIDARTPAAWPETDASKFNPLATRAFSDRPADLLPLVHPVELEIKLLTIDWKKLNAAGIDLPNRIGSLGTGSADLRKAGNARLIQNTFTPAAAEELVSSLKTSKAATVVPFAPKVRTLERRPATVQDTIQQPFVTLRATANGEKRDRVTLVEYGRTVRVNPLVGQDDRLQLHLSLEQSRLVPDADTDPAQTISDVVLTSRKLETVALLRSGQTVILADAQPIESGSNAAPEPGLMLVVTPRVLKLVPVSETKLRYYPGGLRDRAARSSVPKAVFAPQKPRSVERDVRELRREVRGLRRDVDRLIELLEAREGATSREPEASSALKLKWAALGFRFKTLMEQQRFAEAELIAREAEQFAPGERELAALQTMIWKARYARRVATNAELRTSDSGERQRLGLRQQLDKRISLEFKDQPLEEEARLRQQLDRRVSLQCRDQPLQEVMRHIATTGDLNIVLDPAGLDEAGVTAKTPVTIQADGVKLQSALRLILSPLNLDYKVADEVLMVTGQRCDQGPIYIATYPVADLVLPLPGIEPGGKTAKAGSDSLDFKSLTSLIVSTVQPESWTEAGGWGTIRPYESTLALVIRQTQQAHEEIQDVLEQLRRLQDLQVRLQSHLVSPVSETFWSELKANKTIGPALQRLAGNGRSVVLTRDEAAAFRKAVQSSAGTNVTETPRMTLFNGRPARLTTTLRIEEVGSGVRDEQLSLGYRPVVSPDRRTVRLAVAAGEETAAEANVPDGQTLLIDVTERSDKAEAVVPAGGRAKPVRQVRGANERVLLLVTPNVVVQEEE